MLSGFSIVSVRFAGLPDNNMKTPTHPLATRVLGIAARSWFVVVFIGQMIFAYYILMLYWRSAMVGNFEKWNSASPHFYIKGDIVGNLIFGLHVAIAAIITLLGPIQLISTIRSYAPRFHRISGRIYIFSAFIIAMAGLYLTWIKGSVGGLVGSIVISINASIIFVCAFFTIKNAIQRNIGKHNQWAVHLFLGMSGVWLFRVFLMLWLAIFKGPVGFDPKTFTGPFLNALSVFVYVFPQVIVAFYFQAKRSDKSLLKWTFAILLFLITIGIAIGTAVATMGLWLPRI
jgi:hypothetical protein